MPRLRRRRSPRWAEVAATEVVVPERTFSSAISLDLGDRFVELVHPGRGHTAGDLVVRVPDADVVLAGDLVEQTDTGNVPAFGDDCYPMEWPLTLDVVLGLTTAQSVVVPGHGAVVDREFVEEQRNEIGIVAETIRDLATRGVPVDDALAAAEWPYPREALGNAVRRAYEQLPRSQKRLPLRRDAHPAGCGAGHPGTGRPDGMSETPDSEYTDVSVPDEELPEDLQPGDDNPLAGADGPTTPSGRTSGDPHIDGLERDERRQPRPTPTTTQTPATTPTTGLRDSDD